MKIKKLLQLTIFATFLLASFTIAKAQELSEKLSGKILLQVEENGEAWYVYPDDLKRYYLGRPEDAFQIMRELGLGISDRDFNSFNLIAPKKLSGKILLKVEDKGQAYYVNPDNLKMYYLGRPRDAFQIMRELGLGISNNNLSQIPSTYTPPKIIPGPSSKNETQEKIISGKIINNDNSLAIWLKDISNNILKYYKSENGNFEFKNLENGSYKLEVWFEEDLKNKGKIDGVLPIYETSVAIDNKGVNFNSISPLRASPIKQILEKDTGTHNCNGKAYSSCADGLKFFCSINSGAICKKVVNEIPLNMPELKKQIHAIINFSRTNANLEELKWSNILANIADNHSKDMAINDYFDYIEPANCDLICRMNKNSKLQSRFSENISLNYKYKTIYSDESIAEYNSQFEIAKNVVNNWLGNNGSRENLFSEKNEYQGIGIYIKNEKLYITHDLSLFLTDQETKELKTITSSIIASAKTNKEKAELIYGWITSNISYDAKNYVNDTIPYLSYTSIGTFRNKIATCQGYAELARLMFDYAGIKADIITGFSYNNDGAYEDHAWNSVNLDGEELYFDTTWDAGYLQNDNFIRYVKDDYAFIPLECIKVDHARENDAQFSIEEMKNYIRNNTALFDLRCSGLKSRVLAR